MYRKPRTVYTYRPPPRADILDIFNKWHVAYHGIRTENIVNILEHGELLEQGMWKYNNQCYIFNCLGAMSSIHTRPEKNNLPYTCMSNKILHHL